MSSIHHDLFEEVLKGTDIKTVKEYMRLACDHCEKFIFISLTESTKQVNNISENHWKCPKCGYYCEVDLNYACRMLAQ